MEGEPRTILADADSNVICRNSRRSYSPSRDRLTLYHPRLLNSQGQAKRGISVALTSGITTTVIMTHSFSIRHVDDSFFPLTSVYKGSRNSTTTTLNCSTCLLEAESGNRLLRRLEIYLLPNGNHLLIQSAFVLPQVSTLLCLKRLQVVQALQRM